MTEQDRLLLRRQAAERLTIGERTLKRWAVAGIGPRPIKIGPRMVRYRESDITAWLSEQQIDGNVA